MKDIPKSTVNLQNDKLENHHHPYHQPLENGKLH